MESIRRNRMTGKVIEMGACRNPLRWGVQNRPEPRLVQIALWTAVLVPGVIVGVVAAIAADVLTVNWPSGGEKR